MSLMFCNCHSLKELNLSHFNIDNVTNMNQIFDYCPILKELNISNFNTNNVTKMHGMFAGISDELKKKIAEQNQSIEIDDDTNSSDQNE